MNSNVVRKCTDQGILCLQAFRDKSIKNNNKNLIKTSRTQFLCSRKLKKTSFEMRNKYEIKIVQLNPHIGNRNSIHNAYRIKIRNTRITDEKPIQGVEIL